MNAMQLERSAVTCWQALEGRGVTISVVSDPGEAARLLDSTSRPYSTMPLDPSRVAFTRRNAFWIFAHKMGEIYAGCGVRLDDLGDEDFSDYLLRTSSPMFGEPMAEPEAKFPQNAIGGRVVYWGDLIAPKSSAKTLAASNTLRMFCFYAQYRAFTDFNADASYCVMRDRQYTRGAPQIYGFLNSLPYVWDWPNCPFPGGKPEWISYTKRAHLSLLAHSVGRLL